MKSHPNYTPAAVHTCCAASAAQPRPDWKGREQVSGHVVYTCGPHLSRAPTKRRGAERCGGCGAEAVRRGAHCRMCPEGRP